LTEQQFDGEQKHDADASSLVSVRLGGNSHAPIAALDFLRRSGVFRTSSATTLRLGGLFCVLRNLLTEPLTCRVTVESNQRAPELIEVFTPFCERRSTAAKLGNRALQIGDGEPQHRNRQAPHAVIVQHSSGRAVGALGVFARAIRAEVKAHHG
jgi:hypothetical protein